MPEDEIKYIKEKVDKIENDHLDMKQLVRDFQKDFHLLTSSLGEVKDVLKSISKTSTDVALFKQRYEVNREADKESVKRINARLEQIESNQRKVGWLVITAVVLALLKLVIK